MTTLIATKDFLDTLFIDSDKDEYHRDLISFIKSDIFNVKLICSFASIEELIAELDSNPFWELLMDKYDKINFNPNLDNELNDDSFYEKLNEENIFLTSLTQDDCSRLSKERGYIYISSQNITTSWKPIKFVRDTSLIKVTNDSSFPSSIKFDNWDKLDEFRLPLTAIVIFDKYIFSDTGNQRLSDNLFKLLEKLCTNNLLKPITLTIISEFNSDEQIVNSHKKVVNHLTSKLIKNIKVNILKHDKSKYPSDFEGLHYRLILTNNLRIKSDDSFNFFKRNGKVNNDADIHISFHMCHMRKCFYEKELNHINRYANRLNNLPPETPLANKIYYYPDKSNYLFN